MKKTIALLLALLFVAGAVFAEAIYIDKDPATDYPESMNPPYTMNLKAVVPEGGGLDDSDGDDPDNIINGGLYIMVGYNNSNNSYTIGNTYATGDLENLGFYSDQNPLIVSLTPEAAGVETETGTLQFYVAAKSNSSAVKTTTVSFDSDGFENTTNTSAPDIKIKFAGVSEAYKDKGDGLSAGAEVETGKITVSAAAGSYQKAYTYVAQTNATWTKSANTPAGTYTARITVTVTAEA